MIEIDCPLCGIKIPLAHTDRPNKLGLTVGFDERLMDEHIGMHHRCTCLWKNGVLRQIEPTCSVHGNTTEGPEPDPVFADVVTLEDL